MDEHRKGTGTGMGTEARTVTEWNGDEDWNENEDRIGEGGREAKKHKKPLKSFRRHVGHCRKERVGPVAAKPDNLENNKESGGAQGTQGLINNCTSRESVSPLSRLIRGFRNK